MKKFKLVLLFIILVTGLAIRNFQSILFGLFVYWWILILIVGVGWSFHLKGKSYLLGAFVLFFISALLTVVGLKEIGETTMRLSLVGWLVGLIQTMVEYKNSQ